MKLHIHVGTRVGGGWGKGCGMKCEAEGNLWVMNVQHAQFKAIGSFPLWKLPNNCVYTIVATLQGDQLTLVGGAPLPLWNPDNLNLAPAQSGPFSQILSYRVTWPNEVYWCRISSLDHNNIMKLVTLAPVQSLCRALPWPHSQGSPDHFNVHKKEG